MFDLADITILLLFAACAAWLWRGHGIRERALALVRRHCEKAEVMLLDDNVALQRLRWLPDARGQRRLARVYGFEFTVTGEQRHTGSISMFGQHLGKIELAAHPVSSNTFNDGAVIESLASNAYRAAPLAEPLDGQAASAAPKAEVIQLSDWRQRHCGSDKLH
jgi:hypothetical protein